MEKCIICGCIMDNSENNICEVCQDDLEESNPYRQWEKCDFSNECDKDDDNTDNSCWDCKYFCFPIGCMLGEE